MASYRITAHASVFSGVSKYPIGSKQSLQLDITDLGVIPNSDDGSTSTRPSYECQCNCFKDDSYGVRRTDAPLTPRPGLNSRQIRRAGYYKRGCYREYTDIESIVN